MAEPTADSSGINVKAFERIDEADSVQDYIHILDIFDGLAGIKRLKQLAIEQCRVGNRLGDLGAVVQECAESQGFSVVTVFVGHGIGRRMHEDPQVHNYGERGKGKAIKAGLVIAVEPMVNAGLPDVEVLDDRWTAVTKDRKLSAHFEHTIAILDEGPWVLSRASSTPGVPGHDSF